MSRNRGFVIPLLCLGALLLVRCSPAAAPTTSDDGPAVISTDSPLWADDGAWTLSAEPTLSIGVDAGDDAYMFYRVYGAVVLPDGRIVVSNSGSSEVRFFDADGAHLRSVGRRGQGPGEYGEFSSMRLYGPTPDGHLLVGDEIASRFNVLDLGGELVTVLGIAPAPNNPRPSIFGTFADGSLAVTAVDGDGALRGEPGTLIEGMRYQDLRYTAEAQPVGVIAYREARPRFVNQVGGVTNYPFIPLTAASDSTPSGELLWLMAGIDPEIEAYDFDGNLVLQVDWRLEDRVASRDVWDRYVEESLAGFTREDRFEQYRHFYSQELPLPELLPSHQGILADETGHLWVERYRLPWQSQPAWDVIDPDRGWLGTVETPERFQILQITDDAVLGLARDEAGVARIQVYALDK